MQYEILFIFDTELGKQTIIIPLITNVIINILESTCFAKYKAGINKQVMNLTLNFKLHYI
jgi:hypothetical protein